MSRLTKDELFLSMAVLLAHRSTCLRRAVGCVLVDRLGCVISTGYNGVPSGAPHCNEVMVGNVIVHYPHACPAALNPQMRGLEALKNCKAVHAEVNAIEQARERGTLGHAHTCYTTLSPCEECVELLLTTGIERLVFRFPYRHASAAQERWEEAGRAWIFGKIERSVVEPPPSIY